jgi:hypothetical protein
MFQHKEEIKKSIVATWKNKILWVFGLFLAESYVFTSAGISDDRRAAIQKFFGPEFWTNLQAILGDFVGLVIKKYWIFAVLVLVLSLLAILSRGALLTALADVKRGAAPKFKVALKNGFGSFWRLLGMTVLFWLGNLPALAFWYVGIGRTSAALVAIGAALFFLYNIALILFKHYSYCLVVYEQKTIWLALIAGWKMFVKNWRDTVLAQIIRLLATVAMSLATILAIVIITITFFVIGMLIAVFAGAIGFNIAIMIGTIVLFACLFWANSLLNVFVYAYLTKLYWWIKEGK